MALLRMTDAKDAASQAIVLDLGDLRRQGERLIEVARSEAGRIEREARAERARIMAGAADMGRTEGYAKGLNDGHTAGLVQGRDEAVAEYLPKLETLVNGWTVALAAFESERDRMLAEGQRDVIRLAALIASKVCKRTIELDHSVVVAQMAEVLAVVLRPTRLVVSVHPQDRPLLQQAMPALLSKVQHSTQVEFADDPSLNRGSCTARLADGGGQIDASIDTQLDRIVDALIPPLAEPVP